MISIILPVYNESENLELLYSKLINHTSKLNKYEFEFIFINDGSSDTTEEILEKLRCGDKKIHIISFTRNFGSHAAIYCGLENARGDAAIIMTTDLQDPPELIERFLAHWNCKTKVVWAVRSNRPNSNRLYLIATAWLYRLISYCTKIRLPPYGADTVLLDRMVIDALNSFPEKNSSYIMAVSWLCFPTVEFNYIKKARRKGKSKWTFAKKLKLLIDTVLPYSYLPLRLMSLLGIIFACFGILYGIFIIIKAILGIPIVGWASTMISILFIGGYQMIMLGILGEYLWRNYDETRKRPRAVIIKNTLHSNNY